MVKEYLYSDENIVHAFYQANDAIYEKKLLSEKDRKKLNEFKDIFNEDLIINELKKVRKRLDYVLEDNNFFEAEVFFSPKGIDGNSRKYRPIHTASLIDQICMIAMLNTLTNDFSICDDEKKFVRKTRIFTPDNFYGNVLSEKSNRVYKKWQNLYSDYIKKSVEMQNNFKNSLEYRYEISLDLQDFFPSVNPQFIISYYKQHISVNLNTDDEIFLGKILEKLLYIKCKITTRTNKICLKHDYSIDYCGGKLKEGKELQFVRGIPQGLVQGGFFANLVMIEISNIYQKVFEGQQIFYVDDSIVYSNKLMSHKGEEKESKQIFNKLIKECEDQINKFINKQLSSNSSINKIESEYEYNITINKDKSSYILLDKLNEGQIYLKNMSMLVSQVKSEITSDFDTEDIITLKNKLGILVSQIDKEIREIDSLTEKRREYAQYRKRLIRYKKYFKYRFYILQFRENYDIYNIKKEVDNLYKDLFNSLNSHNNDGIDIFNDDIISPLVTYLFENFNNDINLQKNKDLLEDSKETMQKINELLYYSENNTCCSYFYELYKEYFVRNYSNSNYVNTDKYASLINLLKPIFKNKWSLSEKIKCEIVKNYIKSILEDISKCYEIINAKNLFKFHSIINQNSDELYRMIINATICEILNISISDDYDFLKKGNKLLKYNELRVLSIIRNKQFNIKMLSLCKEIYFKESDVVDYSILEVMSYFQHFVKDIEYIDKLIITHEYVCSIWRNGSKYLYFYTLHNQEHAIALIKNSIEIIRSINFIKIKGIDYYILFMACYLHDISMASIPDHSSFCDDVKESNFIVKNFIEDFKDKELHDYKYTKNMMIKFYRAIDLYLENVARDGHVKDSGKAIRKDEQLNFLNNIEREIIAQVSEAHGQELRDVYRRKSEAQQMVCSIKYLKIILRLADVLDMKKNRISKELLQKNINRMENLSAFHWISHLLINDFNIKVEYYTNDGNVTKWDLLDKSWNRSFISKNIISEKISIEIHIGKMILDKFDCNKNCVGVQMKQNNGNITLDIVDSDHACCGGNCNITCSWFKKKNGYLIAECVELKRYLSDVSDNYFKNEIQINIVNDNDLDIEPKYLDIIKKELFN